MFRKVSLWIMLLASFMPMTQAEKESVPAITEAATILQSPVINGPAKLCNFFGTVLGSFTVDGALPQDRYSWSVIDAFGDEIFSRSGGMTFNNVSVNFGAIGTYEVRLEVTRGTEVFPLTQTVEVIQGPQLILEPDYLLCGESPALLTALDPDTPNLENYTIEWRKDGVIVGGGQNQWETREEGKYTVKIFLNNPGGDPDCPLEGSTFVGPIDDFELELSASEVCQNQSIQVSPDISLRGAWFYRKQGETDRVSLETSAALDLDVERRLDGPGVYEIIFEVTNARNPGCVTSRSVSITVNETLSYDFEIIRKASTCDASDGEVTISIENTIDELRIIEKGLGFSALTSDDEIILTDLHPGVYTIEAETADCFRTSVFIVPIDNNEVEDLFEVTASGEVCASTGVADGSIVIEFVGPSINGTYRVLNAVGGDPVSDGPIPAQQSFSIDLPWGFYVVELVDETGCVFPWESVLEISRRNRVDFFVPRTLTICEDFELVPTTSENLIFQLTKLDDGTTINPGSGGGFMITEPGAYRILGRENSTEPVNCPREINFTVNRAAVVDFEPVIVDEDCFGNIFYEVNLFGRDPEDVVIRWLDKDDRIVGRGVNWIPTAFDEFRLEVQLRGSVCESDPKIFTVEAPVFGLAMEFEAAPFCPDIPSTDLELITDFSKVDKIEWLLIRLDGSEEILPFTTAQIDVEEDGFYEAVIYRVLFDGEFCEIGREQFAMFRSTDDTRPVIAEFYSVCRDINLSETIEPGIFEEYQWFLEGNLVSTASTYRPLQAGDYTLAVKNPDGCQYIEEFSVFEDCEFQYRIPTGMIINDPFKLFEVYVNDAVEEARIWIHNRQGQLIHYCEGRDVQSRVAFCQWDGKINGQEVPSGQYIVTLSYKSERFGVDQKVSQGLTIINN